MHEQWPTDPVAERQAIVLGDGHAFALLLCLLHGARTGNEAIVILPPFILETRLLIAHIAFAGPRLGPTVSRVMDTIRVAGVDRGQVMLGVPLSPDALLVGSLARRRRGMDWKCLAGGGATIVSAHHGFFGSLSPVRTCDTRDERLRAVTRGTASRASWCAGLCAGPVASRSATRRGAQPQGRAEGAPLRPSRSTRDVWLRAR